MYDDFENVAQARPNYQIRQSLIYYQSYRMSSIIFLLEQKIHKNQTLERRVHNKSLVQIEILNQHVLIVVFGKQL